MRKEFFRLLLEKAKKNPEIVLLTGDLGYGLLDDFRKELPDRFYNCGAAEQAMLDMAVGLALSGKLSFVYSITPFLLYRPFETLRTYINHEKIPVILVGSGRDRDYDIDGFSHHAEDAEKILTTLPNIKQYYPRKREMKRLITELVNNPRPAFISLKR